MKKCKVDVQSKDIVSIKFSYNNYDNNVFNTRQSNLSRNILKVTLYSDKNVKLQRFVQ